VIRRRSILAPAVLAVLLAPADDLVGAAHAAELAFVLRIEKGEVPAAMRLIRVKQGDVVKLHWSADRRVLLHLHGYDIEREVAPGTATEMVFSARATGRFTVETHVAKATSGGHTHGNVLVTIEVYP
jgi:hypothetical protein